METGKKILQKGEKLRLESMYPYTYVRTNVMRTLLLKKSDYDKLLKMQFSEIARYLQDSQYKAEIDELAVQYSGVELIEMALTKNLVRTFNKLRKISPVPLVKMIDAYLMKYDIMNIKTIMRGVYTKFDKEETKKLIISAGIYPLDFYLDILKKDTVEDVLKSIPFIDYGSVQKFVDALKEKGELFELENELDRHYYHSIISFTSTLPSEGELFRKFLFSQIEMTNTLTIVRMLKEGAGKNDIKERVFWTGIKEMDFQIKILLDSRNIDAMGEKISNKHVRKTFSKLIEAYKENNSLVEFERQMFKSLLQKAILFVHQHPLSINTILGFMFAKEIEIQNLMKIAKGKALGIDEEFISSELVV